MHAREATPPRAPRPRPRARHGGGGAPGESGPPRRPYRAARPPGGRLEGEGYGRVPVALGVRERRAAPGGDGGHPGRFRRRGQPTDPATALPDHDRGGSPRGRRAGLHRHRAAGTRPAVALPDREARRAARHRRARGARPGGRPRPPLPRSEGLPRGRPRGPPRGLRAADGQGDDLHRARRPRAHRAPVRGRGPGAGLPAAPRGAGAAPAILRPARPPGQGRCGLHPPAPRGPPPPAGPARLVPDPETSRRWSTAQRFYREQSQKAFVLDTSLPRSPWWLLPSLGDAVVTFETARRGTLTFGVAGSDPEDLTLFDRRKRLQICMYPSGGRSTRYSEDDARALDILAHDLRVRFDPNALSVSGEDSLRLRLLSPASTLRLRLHDSFRVVSVTSPQGGSHLFFRVRDQGSLVVSLGPYAGRVGEVPLTVRYVGIHDPAPIDQELLQVTPPPPMAAPVDEDVFIERVPVYTNRTAWYPRADTDDHATARLRFEAPAGYLVVSGGELVRQGMEGGRSFTEYRQDEPGKYIAAAVGRFADLGLRQEGRLAVRGFGLPRTREQAQNLLLSTEKVMAFLTDLFGPCPYSFLNLAVLEGRTPGGHSPPGMVLIQQRPPLLIGRTALRDDPASFYDVPGFFLAHELAHQWWGQGVAPQNYRERWLAEAWAQYAAALWVRKSRGEGAFRDILDRFAIWAWRHTDAGPVNLGHRLGHLRGDPQIYRAIVYDKGAYVVHMLRAIVGEEAFDKAIRAFLEERRFSKAGTDDLREALEAASGKDLQPYFATWIYGTALPVLRYTAKTEAGGSGYRTVVEVRPRN